MALKYHPDKNRDNPEASKMVVVKLANLKYSSFV